jgi:hypothetical protein
MWDREVDWYGDIDRAIGVANAFPDRGQCLLGGLRDKRQGDDQ